MQRRQLSIVRAGRSAKLAAMVSPKPPPLYRRLADRVESMIADGSLRAGERIPSVRQFSRQHDVSVPTALQAYVLLETRRLIEARPKSGFYVRPRQAAATLEEPAPARHQPVVSTLSRYTPMVSLMRDLANPALVPMGGAVPGHDLLPARRLARIGASLLRRQPATCNAYDPAPGSLALRRELSRRSLDWGCGLSADDFVVTTGASEALQLALRAVTSPGDTVLVESPAFYGLLNIIAQLRLKVVAVPAGPSGLDLAAAALALGRGRVAAMVVTPNFSNPLGALMPEPERRELLSLAARHGVPVIEDDVYGDLPHAGPRPRCLKGMDTNADVILCGSFSKTLSPGLRIGYIAAGRHHASVLAQKTAFTVGSPTLPSLVVAEFLRDGGYERHLRKLRHTYHRQVARMRDTVAEVFPAGTKVGNPAGGFLLWLELARGVDSLSLCEEARAAGISIAPGPMFSPDGRFKNCLRLSCGFPWQDRMALALVTIARLAAR